MSYHKHLSLMYITNSLGRNINPCGTHLTYEWSIHHSAIQYTGCALLLTQLLNNGSGKPLIPLCSAMSIIILTFNELKT